MSSARRKILQAAVLASLGLAGYSFNRGVRLPTLHWGPLDFDTHFSIKSLGRLTYSDLIVTSTQPNQDTSLRAYAPQPMLVIELTQTGRFTIGINNIASDAKLKINSETALVKEQQHGITRVISIDAKAGDIIDIEWQLPTLNTYKFASIGDTGGDKELDWCIQRAHALGARFLLHLGDFNYQDGDYQRSIDFFRNSPIPVYVSIGNHDFHTSGAIYGDFLKEIGPFNHSFAIGRTRFINIDTAANILPFGAGQRGKLIRGLANNTDFADNVAFTHRPLHDPLHESDHDLGSDGERDWLIKHLKKANVKTLLSGHIHIFGRRDFNGIDNIIVGQGLGHQDLIVNDDYSKMAVGLVDSDGKVTYEMAPLSMPMELHCHPRTDPVKESLKNADHAKLIERIDKECRQGS